MSLGVLADSVDHSGTGLPIRSIDADLDQLVVLQSLFDFGHNRLGKSRIVDNDHGLERMTETAQMTFLAFVELHDRGLISGRAVYAETPWVLNLRKRETHI